MNVPPEWWWLHTSQLQPSFSLVQAVLGQGDVLRCRHENMPGKGMRHGIRPKHAKRLDAIVMCSSTAQQCFFTPRDTPLNMPSKYSKYSKFASSSYTRVPDGCTLDFPLVGISSQQHVQCAAQYEEPTEPLAEIRNIQKSFDVWSSKMQWLAAFLTVNGHPKTERCWHDTHVHIHRLSVDREISKKDRG